MTQKVNVGRFKLFFFYSIDIGHLFINNDKSKEHLLELRAKDGLYRIFQEPILEGNIPAGDFREPILEEDRIKTNSRAAQNKGGKNIWSPQFFLKQVPIIFNTQNNCPLSSGISSIPNGEVCLPSLATTHDFFIKYIGCELRIFKEGILSFRFTFEKNTNGPYIDIPSFIKELEHLEEECSSGYLNRLKNILSSWSINNRIFDQQLHIINSDIIENIVDTATIKHSCIFFEMLDDHNPPKPNGDFSGYFKNGIIPGLLNKSHWFDKYGNRYNEIIESKNIGYRQDEVYITDKDSSIIILSDYWEPNNSLQYYINDLMLATETILSKLAFLSYILCNMQEIPSMKSVLVNPSSDSAIRLVTETRSVITLAYESIDVDSFIIHGFTRTYIKQLMREREISSYINSIERRVSNIHSQIDLQSAINIGKQTLLLDSSNLKWAIRGVFVSIILSLISILVSFISFFIEHLFSPLSLFIDIIIKCIVPLFVSK